MIKSLVNVCKMVPSNDTKSMLLSLALDTPLIEIILLEIPANDINPLNGIPANIVDSVLYIEFCTVDRLDPADRTTVTFTLKLKNVAW